MKPIVSDSIAVLFLGTTPIPGPSPTGASARFEAEFERLAAEIDNLDSEPDTRWPEVVRLSANVLATKSKDLLVASFLTLGLFRTRGDVGLHEGLTVWRDLVRTFWDGLFPEKNRMSARINSLRWLSDRVGAAVLESPPPTASDRAALTGSAAVIEELRRLASARFGQEAPGLDKLARSVSDRLRAVR